MEEPKRSEGLRVGDLGGLVFGYGLAAVMARALVPRDLGTRGIVFISCVVLVYLWIGLAMSGPVILTFDRARREQEEEGKRVAPMRHTRAELCWLLVGGYWIAMMAIFAGNRIPGFGWPVLFILPGIGLLAFALGSLFRRPRRVTPSRAWTHRAALLLMWTWPLVWILIIGLSLPF